MSDRGLLSIPPRRSEATILLRGCDRSYTLRDSAQAVGAGPPGHSLPRNTLSGVNDALRSRPGRIVSIRWRRRRVDCGQTRSPLKNAYSPAYAESRRTPRREFTCRRSVPWGCAEGHRKGTLTFYCCGSDCPWERATQCVFSLFSTVVIIVVSERFIG